MGRIPANICTANVFDPTQSDETNTSAKGKIVYINKNIKKKVETMAVKDNGKKYPEDLNWNLEEVNFWEYIHQANSICIISFGNEHGRRR